MAAALTAWRSNSTHLMTSSKITKTTNQNRRFDDVIKCVELLRQAVRAAAIVKLGLL